LSEVADSQDKLSFETALYEQVEPLVRRIVRWRLGSTASVQDQEDVVADVLLELLVRLNACDPREPIADLSAYGSGDGASRLRPLSSTPLSATAPPQQPGALPAGDLARVSAVGDGSDAAVRSCTAARIAGQNES